MHKRKTRDEYRILSYWGSQYGWEEVAAAETRTEARGYLKDYRENEPHIPHKLVKVRVPITNP